MGKQNICIGFLENGQSEFREVSQIINSKLIHGCVRGDGVMCHYVRVYVFWDSAALNCSDGYAVCLRKAGLCCA